MNVPESLRYAETHEWISLDGEVGIVGITDHAQNELTDIVYVDPPKIGATLVAGQPAAVVESVKAASDIYSPVDGVVLEVNEALSNDPALVNTSPYEEGWLFKVKLSTPSQVDTLKDAAAYRSQIGS